MCIRDSYCGALYYDVIHGTDPFSYTRSSYRFDLQSGQKDELPFTVELCRLIGTTLYTCLLYTSPVSRRPARLWQRPEPPRLRFSAPRGLLFAPACRP